ncbi:MAG: N-acetylmuramoyl-L-alanine amidase [Erysipelotrichaceae bacterium]|nr:N-acetylmuramoyl-L-alanine amidase [Erysipelotrichaceae bacterium]
MPSYYRNERKDKLTISIIMIVTFIVLFLGGSSVINYIKDTKAKAAEGIFEICSYDYKTTLSTVKADDYANAFEIKDYLYYGETLNLFQDTYDINQKDGIVGRTLILTNLCTGSEMVYLIDGKIDGQIPVESLEDGFYSVKIVYDLTQRRAYSTEKIYDVFYTVRRNGYSKEVTLIADKNLFSNDDNQEVMDQNYLFIQVKTVDDVPDDVYDVVIDPGHSSYDTSTYAEYGGKANGLTEAAETYKVALAIKEKLESYGLKVLITRNDSSEVVNTYGENGRLARAYASNAKYYLDLQMGVASSTSISGTQIIYSSFTSSKMASAILTYLLDNTDLVSTANKGSGKLAGVLASGVINNYDGRMVIRESGGRILAAGTFSDKAREENASFALNERNGMQTFTIEYIYITNPEEAEKWVKNYQEYGEKTAEALASYLKIE